MADRFEKDSSKRLSESASSSSDLLLYIRGPPFHLDKKLLAAKSAKAAALLEKNALEDLRYLLQDISVKPEILELIARFCHGYEVQLSSDNIIPVFCISRFLEMDEEHSDNNLFNKAFTFIEQRILPNWNETIKALCASENVLKQAADLGLIDACLESIVEKLVNDPRLLGESIKISRNNDQTEYEDDGNDGYRPNPRRRLFALNLKSEDLTMLSVQLYEPIIHAANHQNVPPEYVVASIWNYAKKWVFDEFSGNDNGLVYKRKVQRDVIEAVERVLPHETGGLIPCSFLFECLKYSILLEGSSDCRDGLEIRIGKQLDNATVQDLLIPSQGYAREVKYDIQSTVRILKAFYGNYNTNELSGFVKVAKLMEEFLAEVASDADLKINSFVSLAEMSVSASDGIQRYSDGIYRAIDIFLEKRRHLTESERLGVCKVLDCQRLSPEASEHASRNERLPLRIVVQVLFVSQLQIRETVAREMKSLEEKPKRDADEEDDDDDHDVDEVNLEMEKMSDKVIELEKECYSIKKKIQNSCVIHQGNKPKKISIWGEVKRKFGCMTGVPDCNCQVKKKKVHPKY